MEEAYKIAIDLYGHPCNNMCKRDLCKLMNIDLDKFKRLWQKSEKKKYNGVMVLRSNLYIIYTGYKVR